MSSAVVVGGCRGRCARSPLLVGGSAGVMSASGGTVPSFSCAASIVLVSIFLILPLSAASHAIRKWNPWTG
eukprot:scaffold77621_cov65-Phaeocystis_antarctica.AAC.9